MTETRSEITGSNTLVRLGWALLSLCGPGIVAYIIAMIVMPQAPENPELKEEPKDDSKEKE